MAGMVGMKVSLQFLYRVSLGILQGFLRAGRDSRDGWDGWDARGSPQGCDLYRPDPTNVDPDPNLDSDPEKEPPRVNLRFKADACF